MQDKNFSLYSFQQSPTNAFITLFVAIPVSDSTATFATARVVVGLPFAHCHSRFLSVKDSMNEEEER